MKIYITTDLEGVAGILLDSQVMGDSAEYQKARRLLTQETNAAVEGALAGGATDVLVEDGHGSGFNFIFEELHPGARYIMGSPRPAWPPEVDRSYAASVFLGCHAMAGTWGAVRDHTMSTTHWHNCWVNGHLVGEIGLWAMMAGHHDIPCVLVSGCERACAEASQLISGIGTAVTKKGLSRYAATLEPAEKVRAMIREQTQVAVAKARGIQPLKVDSPVEIRVEYNITGQADAVRIIPGRRRIDARTIAYRADTIMEAVELM
jgi:D-amino peptidase